MSLPGEKNTKEALSAFFSCLPYAYGQNVHWVRTSIESKHPTGHVTPESEHPTSQDIHPSRNIYRVKTSIESEHPSEPKHPSSQNIHRVRTSIRVETSI
uniref:Uncharacterized protein n=1 Tax=Ixodes scapularis TaxID=6945 RepID=A0A4D5RXU0_IXOSC